MPKRKRSTYEDDANRGPKIRKQDVQDKFVQSRKLLHRALKTAKGFERQKLGKRLKLATMNEQTEEIARTVREIEALKSLDLKKLTDGHLHKTLLKVKSFAESDLLPDEVKQVVPKPEGTEETLIAIQNVTSGMYNTNPVKVTMQQIVRGMYVAMGMVVPSANDKKKGPIKDVSGVKALDGNLLVHRKSNLSSDKSAKKGMKPGSEEGSWEGFDSNNDRNAEDDHDEKQNSDQESLDEEELAKYDALLGANSDEESFDEEEYKAKHLLEQRLSLSLSPTPYGSPSPSHSPSLSRSPSPELHSRPVKVSKAKPALTKGGSTFLPTLMGGYWSGSESSASDLEDSGPRVKKNRPGQAARRAIWEKKYGEKANHVKSGKGRVGNAKAKDDGWDAKRGAIESSDWARRGRGTEARGSYHGTGRNIEKATGENAVAVAQKPRGIGKKDDVGVLHPSWQAAKKAKEMKKTATFQGKKVTFD